MAYEKPDDHPYMTEEEKAYIKLGECVATGLVLRGQWVLPVWVLAHRI